jgi:hypothetical protein
MDTLHDIACWAVNHAHGMQSFQVIYRWGHIMSAMVFVGLTAFFNLLFGRGPETPGYALGPILLRRAFALWRWSALILFFCGLNLLHMLYNFPTHNYFGGDKGFAMAASAVLGTFLVGLSWLQVWPAQRRHFLECQRFGNETHYLSHSAIQGLGTITVLLPSVILGMSFGSQGLSLFGTGRGAFAAEMSVGLIVGWALRLILKWSTKK